MPSTMRWYSKLRKGLDPHGLHNHKEESAFTEPPCLMPYCLNPEAADGWLPAIPARWQFSLAEAVMVVAEHARLQGRWRPSTP